MIHRYSGNKSNYLCRFSSFALAVIGWIMPWNPALAQDAQNCQLTRVASLDMRTGADGRVSVPIKLGGKDFFLMVDTGGAKSTVDPGVATILGLPRRSVSPPLLGVMGRMMDQAIRVENFSMGNMVGKDFVFYLQPSSWSGGSGSIAPDILQGFDVELDFAGGKFNLMSPEHCVGHVIYWTQGPVAVVPMGHNGSGHIEIPVIIDGKDVTATVDTGADYSVMPMLAASRYLGIDENSAGMKVTGRDAKGQPTSYSYPFKLLNFSGVGVSYPDIEIVPNKAMQGLSINMILGMSILRQLHMYISYKENNLYLTSATAH